jgi:signal transduction histidine kinase
VSLRSWLRPPRRLTALFLAVSLVPSVLLVVLGWMLFRQDRDSQLRALGDRHGQAADLVVAELSRHLDTTANDLGDPDRRRALATAEGAVVAVFSRTRAEITPAGRLAYQPVPLPGPKVAAVPLAAGEAIEFRQRDADRAAAWYRTVARSVDPAVQASALIGLARNLRQLGDVEGALTAYRDADALTHVAIEDVPVPLLASWARCDLLAAANRPDDLRQAATAFLGDLRGGRWALAPVVYETNAADARAWLGGTPLTDSEALAAAAADLWQRWQRDAPSLRSATRELSAASSLPVTVVRAVLDDTLVAFLAAPASVEAAWLSRIRPTLERQRVRVTLRDPSATTDDPDETRRLAAATTLPWTVAVVSDDLGAELAGLSRRRTMGLVGLAALTVVLAAGVAVTMRAVTRELAAARLQSDFVAAVSHEFRTPLTTLQQLTEILSDARVTSEPRRHEYYRALARQTGRLQRLVESLLDFGRMEAGARPYRLEARDATALVCDVVESFRETAMASGFDIRLRGNGAAPVRVDRDAMALAIWNLLDNAVKYSREDRTIDVDVHRRDDGVAIAVRDRGLGVPLHERDLIFAKFQRGQDAQARGIKGTGLGLAMVDHIVSAHGGQVELDSEPGQGSTFTIVLPATTGVPDEGLEGTTSRGPNV